MKTKPGPTTFWFYLDTYVYVAIKKDWLMLYNSLTGKILEYHHQPVIERLIKKLRAAHNLGVILLTEAQLAIPEIKALVHDVMDHVMGDLIETEYSTGKPIQMTPLFKIQNDVKYQKSEKGRSVGEHMKKNLTEVSIFINGHCGQHCTGCQKGYQQFHCCRVPVKDKAELPLEKITALWEEMHGSSMAGVNILGGNIFMYSRLTQLLAFLKEQPEPKHYYLHYLNAVVHKTQLKELAAATAQLKLLVTFPLQETALLTVLESARQAGIKTSVVFIITADSDFVIAEQCCATLSIENPVFQPFYNGQSWQMFQENLLVDRDELSQSMLSIQDIHAREQINILNYGRLSILNDGSIHANLNSPKLGTLGQDTLADILYQEMLTGKDWRKTRKKVKPCRQCVFQSLCPPLSNLNRALRKNNLCTIFPVP